MNWSIDKGIRASLLFTATGAFAVVVLILNISSQTHWWLLGFSACIALTFFFGGYLFRAITNPLDSVTKTLVRYRNGELDPARERDNGPREIQTIFGAIDEMAGPNRTNVEIYRDLFENATDIVFMSDVYGRFIDGNRAVERLLGYTVAEVKQLSLFELLVDHQQVTTEVFKRHARGEKYITYQLNATTKSGERKTFEIASRPMFESGKLVGFHGTARDVSERKRMQEALIQARQAAETANQAKSEFLANMSHEIRTPINGIQGFLSLISKTSLTVQQKGYLEPVEESVKNLLKIINDILDLSKIESGQYSIDHEVIDLRSVLTSTSALLRPLAKKKNITLTVDIDADVPRRVASDGTRIGQVVANLLNNAIKFTHAGSITIRVELVKQISTHNRLRITVRDTGIGIAIGDQEKLFAPFQQADSTRSRRYEGTGLGLTITRSLVHAMGGTIKLVSELGEYTEVVVELNTGFVDETECETDYYHEPSLAFDGSGLHVLVVDDNKINRRFLLALLEQQFDATVSEADSGAKAIAMCEESLFDIVLMDIHMADMDGIETTERIRQQTGGWRKTPIVAVSADVIGDGEHRSLAVGLDGFLGKPVKSSDISEMLNRFFPNRMRKNIIVREEGENGKTKVLDCNAGIALASGDERLWRSSLHLMVDQLPTQLDQLTESVEKKDWISTRSLAHRIAGSAGYIAANAVESAARTLEKLCAQSTPSSIYTALGRLRLEVGVLRQHIVGK